MPVRSWIDPTTAESVPLDEGPALFEEAGILPAEATQMMLEDIRGERSEEDPRYLNPSKLYAGLNCRREVVLHRYLEYDMDPRALWAALEGTMWHKAFEHAHAGPEWRHEVQLPMGLVTTVVEQDRLRESGGWESRGAKVCEDGRMRLEVYPGVWMKGKLDRLAKDNTVLIDHKTTRPPYFPKNGVPKDYALDSGDRPGQVSEWTPQINTYATMVEMVTGVKVKEAWAWRMYRGCPDSKYTFRKLRVPLWSREEIWERIKGYCESVLVMLNECYEVREDPGAVKAYVKKAVPMDGHNNQMLNGKKCTEYCALRPICFGIEGLVDF